MKRVFGFLATLMFVFTLAFGFSMDSAFADNSSCELTHRGSSCVKTIATGETLELFFPTDSELHVYSKNKSATATATVNPTIGSQPQPTYNLQPGQVADQDYPTGAFGAAVFKNTSATKKVNVELEIRM